MRVGKGTLIVVAIAALAALSPSAAQAAPAPAWALSLTPMPSNFAPGADPQPEYLLIATNIGAEPTTSDPVVLKALLPEDLVPSDVKARSSESGDPDPTCAIEPPQDETREVICETSEPLGSGRLLVAQITVEVNATPGTYVTEATVSGGGASQAASAESPTQVQANPLEFDFLPGFIAPLTTELGAAAELAGSHPYQQTVAFSFPTENPGDGLTNAGHPHEFSVDLPRGLVGNPAASPVLCTEAELTGAEGCPDPSQVGVADVTTIVGEIGNTGVSTTPLYNMVAPPGTVAELATDIADSGIYAHIFASVRSDGDYGITTTTPDVLALGTQPIFSVQAQVWGDPSAEAHDAIRGDCGSGAPPPCPADDSETPFLTLPSDCPDERLRFGARADSWEAPSPPAEEVSASYESADTAGDPAVIEGCAGLKFDPEIQARLTTNLTDSPSGLDFTLHQPQEEFQSRAPAALRDAVIRFPADLAVNPAQAGGLGACSRGQIGFTGTGAGGVPHFSKDPQSCPEAAKIGTLEVTSPALVRRTFDHKVEETPEGDPILEPLHGSLYIARPFENPFGKLIAVYLVVEDERTGIVAKLAGEGELDPTTGQITTRVKENPELPFEDVKVHLFGGSRGAFVTPPTCAPEGFATEARLTPWSASDGGADALPTDAFQTSATPLGGACPTSEDQLPNAPKLSAGTASPAAGSYSPLLFKLSRADGTQRLGKIEATLPTGLIAKLAGVGTCSEADIAKARSREAPEKGVLEQADPSCPAASEIGVVNAGAGAGPTPFYTSGHAYLAGPYKGAPLSAVAIAPAVAGPFDLGAVVVRSALYLDPASAQGRVVSDPLPQILQGVPVDLRSVAVRAERPDFTLNPTSCSPKSFGGAALSTLGSPAALFERFQVGGCSALPYKPKLSVRLFGPVNRGAHPRLRSVFSARAGDANTRAISFTFPKSEFIDQAHFRTICTRVQFAANQCPAGSIYGHVRAFSPLLDYPLEGPVYLRSSVHKLPDIVLALHGPPHQPLFFEAPGRVDSVRGGLRVRFQSVPDAPLSKVVLTAQGAKKGLFQNSTNICKGTHRATLLLDAQNGKVHDTKPVVKAKCKGKKGKGKGGKKGKGKGAQHR
jgi:hypothetical protein